MLDDEDDDPDAWGSMDFNDDPPEASSGTAAGLGTKEAEEDFVRKHDGTERVTQQTTIWCSKCQNE